MFRPRWEKRLRAFLPTSFNVMELKIFLTRVADDELIRSLKEESINQYCSDAVDALIRRHMIDDAFFGEFTRERPRSDQPPLIHDEWKRRADGFTFAVGARRMRHLRSVSPALRARRVCGLETACVA